MTERDFWKIVLTSSIISAGVVSFLLLRRFRAGIEGCISTAKRVFGLTRCLWKGWSHFQRYVHLSVVSYNLVVLARLLV